MLDFIAIEKPNDPSMAFPYADAALQGRPFLTGGAISRRAYEEYAPVGPDGMPVADFDCTYADGIDVSGTWIVELGGRGDVSAPEYGGNYAFTDVPGRSARYDPASDTTQLHMTLVAGAFNLTLSFSNTRRHASDTTPTGLRYVRLMRPSAPGSSTPIPLGTLFNPTLVEKIRPAAGIRPMGFAGTNNYNPQPRPVTPSEPNPQQEWADRVRPSAPSFAGGSCWEHAIALANAIDGDLWINVPVNASTDYVIKLAKAIAWGTDGVNPYDGPVDNPVWSGLKPGKKVHWEVSNEDWNTGFASRGFYGQMGRAVPAGTGINFDGHLTNDDYLAYIRYKMFEFVRVSDAIRSVVGDAAMNARWNGLIGIQQDFYTGGFLDPMEWFFNGYFPHPLSYYAKGLCTGGYRFLDGVDAYGAGGFTLDSAFAKPLAAVNHADTVQWATARNLIVAVYEASVSPNYVPYPTPDFLLQVVGDRRTAPLVTQLLADARAAGVAYFSYFDPATKPWGLFDSLYDADPFRYDAWLADAEGSNPQPGAPPVVDPPIFCRPIDGFVTTLAVAHSLNSSTLTLADASRFGMASASAPVRLTVLAPDGSAILAQYLAVGVAGNVVSVTVDPGSADAPLPARSIVGSFVTAAGLLELQSAILAAVGAINTIQLTPGPAGLRGPQGLTGPAGPSGAAGTTGKLQFKGPDGNLAAGNLATDGLVLSGGTYSSGTSSTLDLNSNGLGGVVFALAGGGRLVIETQADATYFTSLENGKATYLDNYGAGPCGISTRGPGNFPCQARPGGVPTVQWPVGGGQQFLDSAGNVQATLYISGGKLTVRDSAGVDHPLY